MTVHDVAFHEPLHAERNAPFMNVFSSLVYALGYICKQHTLPKKTYKAESYV